MLLFRKLKYIAYLLRLDVKARYRINAFIEDCDKIKKAIASTIKELRAVLANSLDLAIIVLKEALAKTKFTILIIYTLN